MKTHVIAAVIRRELSSYFSSPTGYVFITIFIFLSAFAAFWLPEFFDRNLANLDQLNRWFPALLLFLVPAITMGTWAEERKQGTDELLLSLPARDWDLVLGKYLACVLIYTVALLFSTSHIAVLAYLGRPDLGLMVTTYLGYWLAGAGLIALGMAASALTPNLTVAFILGSVLCAAVTAMGWLGELLPGSRAADFAAAVSLPDRFRDFGRGVVSGDNLAYFLLLALLGLMLNSFLIGRRHWAGSPESGAKLGFGAVRGAALVVASAALVILFGRTTLRADATQEKLWSLSPQTLEIVKAVDPARPVLITAYVSPQVPPSYTQTKETLLGLLRELDAAAGGQRIAINIVETETFSDAAREARKSFSIEARDVPPMPDERRVGDGKVFMGLALTSGPEQFVLPFLFKGLPVEYELARSIRAVTVGRKKKVGILETDAKVFGEFDMTTMTPREDWPIVAELRKQYDVTRVSRGQPVPAEVDVLLVAQPSSLAPEELKPVLDHLQAGRPAAIFEDPLPLVNPAIATSEARDAGRNPFDRRPPDSRPKADLAPLWSLLGMEVKSTIVIRDKFNPRPQFNFEPEIIFISPTSGGPEPFNASEAMTGGLQEVVLLGAGMIQRAALASTTAPGLTFTPLMRTSALTETVPYGEVLQKSFFGIQGFNPNRRFRAQKAEPGQVVAARVSGTAPGPAPAEGESPAAAAGTPINAVVVADLDAISTEVFRLREIGFEGFDFDNVTLVLNAIDVLAGDESLVELRKRRPLHRTLERLDQARLVEQRETDKAIEEAGARADSAIAKATESLAKRVGEIEQRTDLDETGKQIMVESVRSSEQRRLETQTSAINDRKEQEIEDARSRADENISLVQMRIRTAAVLLPPVPAFLLGCMVFVNRRTQERQGIAKERLR